VANDITRAQYRQLFLRHLHHWGIHEEEVQRLVNVSSQRSKDSAKGWCGDVLPTVYADVLPHLE
jgi:hypothetical protein